MDESTTQDPMHEVKGIVYIFIFASDILYRGSTLFIFLACGIACIVNTEFGIRRTT